MEIEKKLASWRVVGTLEFGADEDRYRVQVARQNANVDRYYIGGWSGTKKYFDYIESNAAFDPDLVEPKSKKGIYVNLCSPWSNLDAEAPELQELENPVNFPDFHEYMSMSSYKVEVVLLASSLLVSSCTSTSTSINY